MVAGQLSIFAASWSGKEPAGAARPMLFEIAKSPI
jgi:hypothetical protein